GSQDVDGGARVIGSYVDLGAYESSIDDLDAQTVYVTTDNTLDQNLRVAVTTANKNANATTINFAITGTCPQVINLSSPLPDITTDVTINGFTEPNAQA